MARILIIDDEELVRFTLRKMFQHTGHEVTEAENGRQGLDLHQAKPFDLVVTDIIMPEQEGVETILELRRDYPQLPIIAISGGGRTGTTDYLRMCAQLGACHTLPKPFSQDELLSAVKHCLNRREKRAAAD